MYEVIVVDNNSTDNTSHLVRQYQHDFPSYPLRYLLESKQGAAFARCRAAREARGTWIGFLDDDNLPALDWVVEVYRFGKANPRAGAFSSRVLALYETEPPPGFSRIDSFLAIKDLGDEAKLFYPQKLFAPSTAGLVVRRDAWKENIPDKPTLPGRIGTSMVGGEDYEISIRISKGGWSIWYNPKMVIHHCIPAWRLEPKYLVKLTRGCALSQCHLWVMSIESQKKLGVILWITLLNLLKTIGLLSQYRFRIANDIVARCEVEFLFAAFLSPIYFLFTKLLEMGRNLLSKLRCAPREFDP